MANGPCPSGVPIPTTTYYFIKQSDNRIINPNSVSDTSQASGDARFSLITPGIDSDEALRLASGIVPRARLLVSVT